MSASQFHSRLRPSSLDKLKAAIKQNQKGSFKEEGVFQLTVDKAGNGAAVIRFLPDPDDTQLVSYWRHFFKGPSGKSYVEKCRTSLADSMRDPCVEYTARLYASKDPALEAQGSKQARRKTFVSNILVLQDKACPENEGKVFIYRYGPKILEKITKCTEAEFEGDVAFDPFDPMEGANFRLRQKKQGDFPNYDDSSFDAPSPLFKGDEEKIKAIRAQCKPLAPMVAPDAFKTYDELQERLNLVLGFDTTKFLTPEDAESGRRTTAVRRGRPAVEEETEDESIPTPGAGRKWTPPPADDDDAPVASSDDDDDVTSKLREFDDE